MPSRPGGKWRRMAGPGGSAGPEAAAGRGESRGAKAADAGEPGRCLAGQGGGTRPETAAAGRDGNWGAVRERPVPERRVRRSAGRGAGRGTGPPARCGGSGARMAGQGAGPEAAVAGRRGEPGAVRESRCRRGGQGAGGPCGRTWSPVPGSRRTGSPQHRSEEKPDGAAEGGDGPAARPPGYARPGLCCNKARSTGPMP